MKKLKVILAALVFLPAFHFIPATAQVYTPDYIRFTLDNGLTVILHQDMVTASVSINMAYHAGSSRDPKGKHGLANICGTIATLGSKNVSYRDMLRLQYFAAAKVTGRTTVDLMSVSSTFPAEYLDVALWVEADRMKNAAAPVTDNIVSTLTGNLRTQRRKARREPLSDVDENIYSELYPVGHPYRYLSLGDTTEIESLRARDVTTFMNRYYTPANAVMTIAGNFELDEARSLVKKHFASLPSGKSAQWNRLPDLPALGIANIIKEDIVSNSRLYVIVPTVARNHPDAPVLDLLAKFLSGTVSAFLEERLVDKNPYVTAVEVSQSSRELDGNFWIVINCNFEASLKDIFANLKHELDGLAKASLGPTDLDEARNYTKMLYSMVMEEPFGLGGRAETMNCNALLEDSPLFLTNTVSSQLRTSPNALQAMLKKYFTFDNVLTLSIVPNGMKSKGAIFED